MLEQGVEYFERHLSRNDLRRDGKPAPYHGQLSKLLHECWPGASLEETLRKTFLTNSVLCSAVKSGGYHCREVERACCATYLKPTLDALPRAFVLALGKKAARRLRQTGVSPDYCAIHPSSRYSTKQKEKDWERAGSCFRGWLDRL